MPKTPSLDDLNARLERAGKMLDGCATMIRDNAEIDSANIRNIGDALVAVFEITSEIYKLRPDLMPDFLKPEPIKALYAEFEVYRSEPTLVQMIEGANEKSRRLRELVLAPEILVMPGAWDPLSAILFEHLGFEAIQGSSSAIAAALGFPDGEVIGRRGTIGSTREIAAAVSVPVNADGEAGYGGPEQTSRLVHGLINAGAAGMNLEDSIPSGPMAAGRSLAAIPDHREKIAAVMETKRAMGSEFFLNARVDAFAVMREDPKAALAEAIKRGNAYAEAGADCIFYLGQIGTEVIATLVRDVHAPVSMFAGPYTPSIAELQELGVARVSYGSAFQRVGLAAIRRLAEEMRDKRSHNFMSEAIPGPELQEILRGRR